MNYDKTLILELSLSRKNQNVTVQDEFSFFKNLKLLQINLDIKFQILSFKQYNQMFFGKSYSLISEIIFENDISDDKEIYITYISIFTTKFPSIKKIITLVKLRLPNGYDQSSWSEIKNCNNSFKFRFN
ncbi:hypothetical protein ACTFIU_008805 [Dictyostelium citrinum]